MNRTERREAQIKAIRSLDERDLLYLAGLMEGEGCFSVRHRIVKGKRYTQVGVSLQMIDRDVVARVGQLIRQSHREAKSPQRPSHWSQPWVLTLYGPAAEELMHALLPHMGERRSARIKECLSIVHGLSEG